MDYGRNFNRIRMTNGIDDLAGGFEEEEEELTNDEYSGLIEDDDKYSGLFQNSDDDDDDDDDDDEFNKPDDRLVQLKRNIQNRKKGDTQIGNDDIYMYSLVETLPETKTTCKEMRKKSLGILYKFINCQINIIEQKLEDVDFVTFSCNVEIDVKDLDESTIKKVRKILKWFYIQRKFSINFTKDNDVLTLIIDWGDFKFLV